MEMPTEVRIITLQEFHYIFEKMKFYKMQEGYIGDVKGKIELFVAPCAKATALITITEVEQAISDYANEIL
jgi:hypothetical protein